MKVKEIAFVILGLLAIGFSAHAQMELSLHGFQLGQYRTVVKNVLGEPMQKDKHSDGFEYEVFLIKPDTSLYMVIEYAANNLDLIWAIQLTGRANSTDFKGLNLGMDEKKVLEVLGSPTEKIDIGEYGQRYEYPATNYSVEINKRGKLASIKIKDTSHNMFPKPDFNKMPSLAKIAGTLKSGSNKEIQRLLCPDIEVWVGDSILSFTHSIREEIINDFSHIFRRIRDLSLTLDKVNTKDLNEYEENLRVSLGQDPKHVIKIKKGQRISEIVFKWWFGEYLIWEIRAQ